MNDSLKHAYSLRPEQQAIRDKCFHPSGTFVEFPKENVETSIPERFEKIARRFPHRLVVKTSAVRENGRKHVEGLFRSGDGRCTENHL
jgi:hypothetical protein